MPQLTIEITEMKPSPDENVCWDATAIERVIHQVACRVGNTDLQTSRFVSSVTVRGIGEFHFVVNR